jgi:hypothetical protein
MMSVFPVRKWLRSSQNLSAQTKPKARQSAKVLTLGSLAFFQQRLEVLGDLTNDQIRAVWIMNEEKKLPVLVVDTESIPPENEVNPGLGEPIVDEMDHSGLGQLEDMVTQDVPRHRLWKTEILARTVFRSQINDFHGVLANTLFSNWNPYELSWASTAIE